MSRFILPIYGLLTLFLAWKALDVYHRQSRYDYLKTSLLEQQAAIIQPITHQNEDQLAQIDNPFYPSSITGPLEPAPKLGALMKGLSNNISSETDQLVPFHISKYGLLTPEVVSYEVAAQKLASLLKPTADSMRALEVISGPLTEVYLSPSGLQTLAQSLRSGSDWIGLESANYHLANQLVLYNTLQHWTQRAEMRKYHQIFSFFPVISLDSPCSTAENNYQADLFFAGYCVDTTFVMKVFGKEIPVKDGIGRFETVYTRPGTYEVPITLYDTYDRQNQPAVYQRTFHINVCR